MIGILQAIVNIIECVPSQSEHPPQEDALYVSAPYILETTAVS